MKAVILAGGRGTRIAEESSVRPKPMITIGGQPILLHILRTYAAYGVTEFVICLGYKGYMIKEFFANYLLHSADVVDVDIGNGTVSYDHLRVDPWRVTLVERASTRKPGGASAESADGSRTTISS